ncbi:4'-phosphopantetheinyl transferase superfamily protein [Shewanella mesophila]|nr:4'-phosphopantetheinyl transferase superfamily protein [Shewanella mesophila]
MVRGYLRTLLTTYAAGVGLEITPSQWRFVYGDKGKPRLTADQFQCTQIAFNISHSGDYLMVSITHGAPEIELGADIERLRASTNIYPILNHYFTEQERDALLALPKAEQRERFFNLWALKESYIKAKGLGLALSLKSFGFCFDSAIRQTMMIDGLGEIEARQAIGLVLHQESMLSSDSWSVTLAHIDATYRFAVCINRPSQRLHGTLITMRELLQRW